MTFRFHARDRLKGATLTDFRILRTCSLDRRSSSLLEYSGDLDAECCGEVVLVFLFLREDFTELLGERVMTDVLGLFDALAVVPDCVSFVVEVKADHFFCFV